MKHKYILDVLGSTNLLTRGLVTAEVLRTIHEPVEFLFRDNNFSNYFPCFQAIEHSLTYGATIVADNVGIGAKGLADYLKHVRSRYDSQAYWFDTDLPWVKRDAMEVSIHRSHQ